jgi:hypothetical protein
MKGSERDEFFFAAPRRGGTIRRPVVATRAAVLGALVVISTMLRRGWVAIAERVHPIHDGLPHLEGAVASAIAREATERIHHMKDRIERLRTARARMRRAMVVLVAIAGSLALAIPAFATTSGDAGFEGDDGNLAPEAPINFDWNSFYADDGGTPAVRTSPDWSAGTAPYRIGSATASGWTFTGIEDAQNNQNDSVFGGGVKQDNECPSVNEGPKPPNKDDLKRIYITHKTGTDGHVYLALAWARIPQNTTSASAHVAFEFNQNDPDVAGNACPAGSDSLVKRSTANGGDFLIVYDFEGGSDPVVLKLLRWKSTGTCEQTGKAATSAGCWVLDPTFTDWAARVNTADALDRIAPDGDDTLHTQEFGEAIVDLTPVIFPELPTACLSFGRAFGVSRSSGNSGQAQMKDLVGPADVNIANCATVIVRKVTKDTSGAVIADGTSLFGFSTNVQTLPGPNAVADFNLTGDATATPSNSKTISNVQPNTARTVTEKTPLPSPYAIESILCTGGSSISYTTYTATFNIGAGQTVTCTFTNRKQKQESAMNTSPWIYPNDKATVTSTGATGSVTFKLYGATTSPVATAQANCLANVAQGLLYTQTVNLPASAPLTVNTSNPGGGSPGPTSVKVEATATVYWRVQYSGDSSYFGRLSDCVENINATLTPDTVGTNVPDA